MSDPVNSPSHYRQGKIEVIEFIRDQDFGYLAGNVVKYVARHLHKGKPLEDLKKARWYLNRLIDELEKEAGVMDEGQEKAIHAVTSPLMPFYEMHPEHLVPGVIVDAACVRIKAPKTEWYLNVLLQRGSCMCGDSRDGRHAWGEPKFIVGVQRYVAFCMCEAACYQDPK